MAGNPLYYRFDNSGQGISEDHPLPVTQAGYGALDDAAWDGTGEPTSIVALLKYQCVLLEQIATNTAA